MTVSARSRFSNPQIIKKMNPQFSLCRAFTLLLIGGLLLGSFSQATAQCSTSKSEELAALGLVADSLTAKLFKGNKKPGREQIVKSLDDQRLYLLQASLIGTAVACLQPHQQLFESAAIGALAEKESYSPRDVRLALAEASTTVLEQIQSRDRIRLMFGLGFNAVFNKEDTQTFKLVSRQDTMGQTQQFIALESDSGFFPGVSTGVVINLRERADLRSTRRGFLGGMLRSLNVLAPTSFYGSIQFTGEGNTGPINGATLGVGWRLVRDALLLVGISTTRFKTLRADLRMQWEDAEKKPILLPAGESGESMLGIEGADAISITLAIPISFQGILGR